MTTKNETPKDNFNATIGNTVLSAVEILPQKRIEEHFDKCDFDDECDFCDNPSNGTYAKLYHEPEGVTETEYYICGKCASEAIPVLEEEEKKNLAELDKYIEKWALSNQ